MARRYLEPRTFEVEGNNGGSYVRLTALPKGMVELSVGETLVTTVSQTISVAALACILTAAKDEGFQAVVDRYLSAGGGQPTIRVDRDPASP